MLQNSANNFNYVLNSFNHFKRGLFKHKKHNILLLPLFLIIQSIATAQIFTIDKKQFFNEEQLIEITLTTDFRKLYFEKQKKENKLYAQPASITCIFYDSIKVTEEIEIRPRGEFRREECSMTPVMLNFKATKSNTLKKLGKLKLVWPCETSTYYEQLVIKEYLVYKIYNLLTEKSFKTRLVRIATQDSKGKNKPLLFFAFFIEDVDDMARRNNCKEMPEVKLHTEQTNRKQTTLLSLFEYMIGNTDWAIPLNRNVKLIVDKKDSLQDPFAVPYDFDYCGLVNAEYAIPPPELQIVSVRNRLYRGFARNMKELQEALHIFHNKKAAIDSLITNCNVLSWYNKKEMIDYINEFYKSVDNDKKIKYLFIDHARKQ